MSNVLRSVKNVTKGYSSVQVKVRNATSNDPWGPTGTDMADIAKITFNSSTDFYEVMDMLDKRLNDKGKNWRHVLKSLKVLDYCLHEGSELVVTWARKNVYIIKTLREFIYLDEEGRDVGAAIRHSAKELSSLILDEERLRAERANRGSWKSRVTGLDEFAGGDANDVPTPRRNKDRRQRPTGASSTDEDDLEYRLALEASKNEAESDAARRAKGPGGGEASNVADDDDDLAKAIRLSKEEEELRKRELEDQNQSDLLFDPSPPEQTAQPTGFNQGYQQQAAVDWFGNPVQQQQQQQQPQYIQPQNTYNPWAQQMNNGGAGYGQPQPALQQQPQQTGFLNNAYAPTPLQSQPTAFQNGYASPGSGYGYPAQPQMQEQPTAQQQPGSNNPWASLQNGSSGGPMAVQPTGSNNPFAARLPSPQQQQPQAPSLSTLQTQPTAQHRPNPITNYTLPSPPPLSQQPPPHQDPYASKLNALLSNADGGQDTFGNVGDLRIPAQHTTPGTFVNSAGAGSMGRLEASRTGNNPFYSAGGQRTQQQVPAQTGPAAGLGYGANQSAGGVGYGYAGYQTGLFSGPGGQQQSSQGRGMQGQGGGSLIDL